MSESAGVLGIGFSITYQGRTWKFVPMDNLETVALYETYLEDWAFESLRRRRPKMTPQEYREQSEGVRHDMVADAYAYGGKVWAESMQSRRHQKHLLWLMGVKQCPDLTPEVIDAMWEDPGVRDEINAKLTGVTDPNAPSAPGAPAATT
jgi:hypothetical protein